MATNVYTGPRIETDLTPRPKAQQCPRPRETKVLQAIVEGKSVAKALRESGFHPESKSLRERLKPGGDLREELDALLTEQNLGLPRALKTLSAALDARKTIQIDKSPHEVADNDARLRAVDMTLKLQEKAGRIPSGNKQSGGGAITVNVLVLNDAE